MFLFYTSHVDKDYARLTEDEHRHCSKVLRKKIGDSIDCTDGLGTGFHTRISTITKAYTELEILDITSHPLVEPILHVAVALPKHSSRVDFMIEKLVETGTQIITPVVTAHSERKKLNIDRYRKKVVSSATQSLKYHFPTLNDPVSVNMLLSKAAEPNILIAHYNDGNKHLSEAIADQKDTLILIGPEGDFSTAELEQFAKKNYQFVNLSQHRLRTETAAIAASVIFNSTF